MLKKLFGSLFGSSDNSHEDSKPGDRIVNVENTDEVMEKAIKEAKRTLPGFLKFFDDAPSNTDNHRVKVMFSDSNGNEHIWVSDIEYDGDDKTISGIVSNTPGIVECVEAGEEVTVPISQVTDWAFECEGQQYGNFTVYALFTQMAPAEVESYVKHYGFVNNPLEKPGASFKELIKDLPEDDGAGNYTYQTGSTTTKSALDPETYHGTHYKVEDFDAELEKRVAKFIKEEEEEEGEKMSKEDISSLRRNVLHDIYCEWNGIAPGSDAVMDFDNRNSQKYHGYASFGHTKAEDHANNPFMEPVHGVTLEDYAAISYYVASGTDAKDIVKQLGIDYAIWEEANVIWAKRMQEDTSFTVVTLFGQFYNTADQHPKLSSVKAEVSAQGQATLDKLKSDRYFYEELAGARTAAFECGMDGSKWLMDNHGVSLGDFQKVATMYSEQDQQKHDTNKILEYANYQEKKQKEYTEKFSAENGGNIADDVSF
jgi:uncharacterized protein YegJ (DUF2314 family)